MDQSADSELQVFVLRGGNDGRLCPKALLASLCAQAIAAPARWIGVRCRFLQGKKWPAVLILLAHLARLRMDVFHKPQVAYVKGGFRGAIVPLK